MRAKELIDQVPANYDQMAKWIENGIKIGSKSKGPGYPRDYSEIDVKIVLVLSALSPLIGSGHRVPSAKSIMKKVATQVRNEPSIADRKQIYVSTTGRITETPGYGWVVVP